MTSDRLLSGAREAEDLGLEPTLRPQSIADYVGQERIVDNLKIFIRAAREHKAGGKLLNEAAA